MKKTIYPSSFFRGSCQTPASQKIDDFEAGSQSQQAGSCRADEIIPERVEEEARGETASKGRFYGKREFGNCLFTLPLFETKVSAGFPSPADDHFDQSLDLNEHLVKHPAATFFVKVEGHSMQGAGIFPGDILIVDRALKPKNGSIILAVLEGDFTVKRIMMKGKQIFLKAENPRYPPIEITEEKDFQVWGVVTYIIHQAV